MSTRLRVVFLETAAAIVTLVAFAAVLYMVFAYHP
jgi:hypothetical protein